MHTLTGSLDKEQHSPHTHTHTHSHTHTNTVSPNKERQIHVHVYKCMFMFTCLPDKHTLIVSHSPHGHIDLVGNGKDVRRELTKLLVHVQLHLVIGVETIYGLIRIDCRENGTNVGLWWEEGREGGRERVGGRGREGERENHTML